MSDLQPGLHGWILLAQSLARYSGACSSTGAAPACRQSSLKACNGVRAVFWPRLLVEAAGRGCVLSALAMFSRAKASDVDCVCTGNPLLEPKAVCCCWTSLHAQKRGGCLHIVPRLCTRQHRPCRVSYSSFPQARCTCKAWHDTASRADFIAGPSLAPHLTSELHAFAM